MRFCCDSSGIVVEVWRSIRNCDVELLVCAILVGIVSVVTSIVDVY